VPIGVSISSRPLSTIPDPPTPPPETPAPPAYESTAPRTFAGEGRADVWQDRNREQRE
jgi:hypothetical protein